MLEDRLFPAHAGALSPGLLAQLVTRAQGNDALAAAYERGQTMDLDTAVAFALELC